MCVCVCVCVCNAYIYIYTVRVEPTLVVDVLRDRETRRYHRHRAEARGEHRHVQEAAERRAQRRVARLGEVAVEDVHQIWPRDGAHRPVTRPHARPEPQAELERVYFHRREGNLQEQRSARRRIAAEEAERLLGGSQRQADGQPRGQKKPYEHGQPGEQSEDRKGGCQPAARHYQFTRNPWVKMARIFTFM